MKILHTSDWHLGRSLYGRKRYTEFSAFLDWLVTTIESENVDILLVAGDIFDTSTPSNRAQELYYQFLSRIATSCCRHVVIVAGNHDSPSFLNAPKELLRALNVHVVGAMSEDLADEVIVLTKNQYTEPQIGTNEHQSLDDVDAIICAVPYLRDKDIRTVAAGETIDDKNCKLLTGIKQHYAEVVAIAEKKRRDLRQSVPSTDKHISTIPPIIAMGHLFTAGGKTVAEDGVRELYVGSLACIAADAFPSAIDYLALGHLHVPQAVGGNEHIRYSGSPLPMGFGEAKQEKSVVIVEFKEQLAIPEPLMDSNKHRSNDDISEQSGELVVKKIPCFQQLVRIAGSLDDIQTKLTELKQANSAAWLEIEYTDLDIIGNLREILDEALVDTAMEIRRIKNKRLIDRVINTLGDNETLDDLNVNDVFNRCLDTFDVPDADRDELIISYNEIINDLMEQDTNAE